MSAITVNIDSQGAESVIRDLKKIENASDRTNKSINNSGSGGKQKNMGYAALEVSRGVEDFAAAGMRGLLNNIPQMLLFAGATPAMAAGVSLLAVAATVAGPRIFDMSKALDVATKAMEKADSWKATLDRITDALWNLDFAEWAKSEGKALQDSMTAASNSISAPVEEFEKLKKAETESSAAAEKQIKLRQKLSDITAKKEDAPMRYAERDYEESQRSIKSMQDEAKALQEAKEKVETASISISNPESKDGFMGDGFTEQMKALEVAIALMKKNKSDLDLELAEARKEKQGSITTGIAGIEDTIKDVATDLATGQLLKGTIWENDALLWSAKVNAGNTNLQRNQKSVSSIEEEILKRNEAITSSEREMKTLLEKNKLEDQSVENYSKLVEQADKETKAIKEKQEANERALAAAQAELAIKKDIAKATAYQAAEEELKKLNDYAMNTQVDPRNLLSSKGRVGLSAREGQNALGVVNLQRQANKWLGEIARNTRKKLTSTYG